VTVPDLVPYGWTDRWAALFAAATDDPPRPGAEPGRVVRHDGAGLLVALPGGPRALALAGLLDPPPTVGDWLVVDGDVPAAVLDRTSLLARRAAGSDTPQPLAANVDLVLAVCGLDRPVKAGRIDRVATLAWDAGAMPAVALTKGDLVADPADRADAVAAAHPGLDVVATSAATGEGLGALRALVGDLTVVLVGESGAGKSSLANALVGHDVAATGRVRAGDAKGRHTTTSRHAVPLPGGGVLIDTPGLRAVGLWADREAVAATFADVDDLATGCRFGDCGHDGEPGCEVAAAVADGRLPADRLDGWRALEREAAAAERRAAPHLLRAHGKRFARVARDAQRRKGRD
jgi:ribosome biogenesis GTPase